MKNINGRYEIVETISNESNTTEYLVLDHLYGGMLKRMCVFEPELSNVDFVKDFERCFIDLKSIQHECLVNLFEFSPLYTVENTRVSRQQFYYTYEHTDDSQLVSYLELDKSELSRAIVEICKAIRFLHYRGFIYKLLSFDHIKIFRMPKGIRVKLTDVAHISIADYRFKTNHETVSDFIAPEVYWGETLSPRADVFSLGKVFYYLYFQVDYRMKGIEKIAPTNPLHRFILKATSQIYEERHESVLSFIDEMSRLLWIKVDHSDIVYYDKLNENTRIIGRDKLVADIREMLEAKSIKSIKTRAIFLEGEEGSGRSRIIREIHHICYFRRYMHIAIRQFHTEEYHALRSIVRHILKQDDVNAVVLTKYDEELRFLAPDLVSAHKGPANIDPVSDRLRIINRVINFLNDYCANKYFVVLVDNSENLSDTERVFFEQLLLNESNNGCLVIFAGKDDKELSKKHIEEMVQFNFSSLSLDEIAELVKAILGVNYYPYQLVHKLMVESQGNPAMIRWLLKTYYEIGVLSFNPVTLDWDFDSSDIDYRLENRMYPNPSKRQYKEGISDCDLGYLRILSVLRGDYNMRVMFEMIDVDEEEGYSFLYRADDRKVLNQRISDVEYVFSFRSKDFQRELFNSLTEDEVVFYNRKAADIYIERYKNYHNIELHLISYLKHSNQLEEMYQYSLEFAETYLKMGLHYQAIELYEHAKEAYSALGKKDEVVRLSLKIGSHLTKLGRLDLASAQFEFVIDEAADPLCRLDARIETARILLMQSKLSEAKKLASECMENAEKLNAPELYFEALLLLNRCHQYLGSTSDSKEVLSSAMERAIEHNRKDYFYLLQADAVYTERHSIPGKEAVDVIDVGIKYFEGIDDMERSIELLDQKGRMLVFAVGDYNSGRDCFRESNLRAMQIGLTLHQASFHKSLGDSYWQEGRYDQAANAYEQAFSLAEKFGLRDTAIVSLSGYCQSQIMRGEYGRANTLLSKLEHELQVNTPRNTTLVEFRLMQIEYYLELNNIQKVKQLRYDFDSRIIRDRYRSFWLKVLDVRIDYNTLLFSERSDVRTREEIVERVFELYNQVRSHRYAKLLRELILKMMLDLLLKNDILYIDRLSKLDDDLSVYYNTQTVRFRRELIRSYMNDYTISRISKLLSSASEHSPELQWRIRCMLGNLYCEELDYYNAFKSYLYALDILSDITNQIPSEHKSGYILGDSFKIDLRSALYRIIRQIGGESEHGGTDMMVLSVDDFFNTQQIDRLLSSEAFEEISEEKHGRFTARTGDDLIRNLSGNSGSNFKTVLECMMADTFAERGFLYLLDENETISDVISANEDDEVYDVMRLIYSTASDEDGLFISKVNAKSSAKLLSEDQKGLICFPIFASSDDRRKDRRKYDMFESKKKVVAYVFLDSTNVINRFNEASFRRVKSYSGLINLFIDNFNLRKNATLDKLTGVLLRKHLEHQFSTILSTSRRQGIQFSVVMLDIDRFKVVNDTYGHRKGDEILMKLGELLVRSTRSTDLVGRYGGEEFILLLPETAAGDAYKVGEKIRRTVEEAHLMGEGRVLTISLGISTYPEDGVNEEELIEKADQALYYSKNNGRNRTTSWDPILLKSGHRYDRLTGIITGQIATDTRNVQAMLRIVGWMDSDKPIQQRREDIFSVLLDIVQGRSAELYTFDKKGRAIDQIRKYRVIDHLQEIDDPDYRNIEKYRGTNSREYFIDWANPLYKRGEEDLLDWESLIVQAFKTEEKSAVLLIRSPISEREFDYSNFNFVDSLRPILERTLL